MARKHMKVRKIVLSILTVAMITSQLAGCATISEENLITEANEGSQVEIEVALPSDESSTPGLEDSIVYGDSGSNDAGDIEDTNEVKEPVILEGEAPVIEEQQLFTEVNETVYATGTVNIRAMYSASSDKVGSLSKGESIKRTGIGLAEAEGWSQVQLSDGSTAYISSQYLSTTKPVEVTKPTPPPKQTEPPKQAETPKETPPGPFVDNDEGRKLAEEGNSGGLAGLINADNGGDPDAFKDTGSKGNVDMGIQVAG